MGDDRGLEAESHAPTRSPPETPQPKPWDECEDTSATTPAPSASS